MATVTITANLKDVNGIPDNTAFAFRSPVTRIAADGTSIVTTHRVRVEPVAGVLTVQLEPGPCTVSWLGTAPLAITIPSANASLWPLIAAAVGTPPGTPAQALTDAIEAYLLAHPPAGGSGGTPADGTVTTAKIVDANVTLAKLSSSVQTSLGKADTAVQPAGLTKAAVGLGSADNTPDTAKPVSTAQQTALDLKAPLASPAFTGTPTGVTKTHVGLGNVDDTADTAKPVSTAQQTALDGKQPVRPVAATVTADGALTIGAHNPVDATSGNRAMTLANAATGGQEVSFEKVDASSKTVTVTLNLRGTAGSPLTAFDRFSSIELVSKSDGSWWPVASHQTLTAHNKRFMRRDPRNNFVAMVGDSNGANGATGTGAAGFPGPVTERAILAQACLASGKQIYQGIWCVGGAVVADVNTSQLPSLLSTASPLPGVVVVMIGTNNAGTTTPLSGAAWTTFQADYIAMCDTLTNYGIVPLLTTILPKGALAGNPAALNKLNQFIRKLAAARSYPIADVFSALTSTGGAWKTGMTIDNTLHVSEIGAKTAGAAIGAALDKLYDANSASVDLITAQGNITGTTAGALNNDDTTHAFGNGLCVDSDANGTPNLWGAASNATVTSAPDATLTSWGNVMKLVSTSTAAVAQSSTTFPLVAGRRYRFAGRIRLSVAEALVTTLGGTLLRDRGVPSNALGIDGDWYIDVATASWYGPKAAGVWPASTVPPNATFRLITSDFKTTLFGVSSRNVDVSASTFCTEFTVPATNSDATPVTGLGLLNITTTGTKAGMKIELGQITLIDLTTNALDTVV